MMFDEQEDKKIKNLLHEWTDVDKAIQQKTWKRIDDKLFGEIHKRKSIRRTWLVATLSFAIGCFLLFSFFTAPGQAFVQEIKDLFVPEKKENIEIEGMTETTDVQLHANEALRYVIYIDEERYKMEEAGDVDRIVTKEPLGEGYPEVYMEISQEIGKSKEELIQGIKEDSMRKDFLITNEEKVSEPVESILIETIEQDETTGEMRHGWDTMIEKYYVIEVSENHFFIVKQVYFQEAAEGHGARFYHMLTSFDIIH